MKRDNIAPALLMLVLLFSCGNSGQTGKSAPTEEVIPMEKVRKPAVAGAFYPGDARRLTSQVDSYLSKAAPETLTGDLLALISPHAGYIYSGPVAAYSYKLLEGKTSYDTVVIVAPSHYLPFAGASVYQGGGYQTPLGVVPVNSGLSARLIKNSPCLEYVEAAHHKEHSLEVQIPFLQHTLKDFKLVAVVMGSQDWDTCQKVSHALVKTLGQEKNILLVASSDLSHYHPYAEAVKLDRKVQSYVSAYDPMGLSKALSTRKCEACGGGPVITVMLAAQQLGAQKAKVLKYANSGDTAGDKSQVVGYMAAALVGKRQAVTVIDPPEKKEGLTDREKKSLLKLARQTIAQAVKGEKITGLPQEELTDQLREIRGAFVTIKKQGRLRGCIGHIVGRLPLYLTVKDMAKAAAMEDPRFSPVQEEELHELELEISALTPLKKVEDPEKIEVGKHGLLIKRGWHSGVLLPQVPTEYGWDRRTFLEQTCKKAGLPPDSWNSPDAELFSFTAEVFQ
ncbi:MAG: AmmeMemoRadiSam system protein B [bacterium]